MNLDLPKKSDVTWEKSKKKGQDWDVEFQGHVHCGWPLFSCSSYSAWIDYLNIDFSKEPYITNIFALLDLQNMSRPQKW